MRIRWTPNPVTNAELAKTLGHVLHRPSLFHVPKFLIRSLGGQAADELLLSSCRALPGKLLSSGFEFHCPDLDQALRHLLSPACSWTGS